MTKSRIRMRSQENFSSDAPRLVSTEWPRELVGSLEFSIEEFRLPRGNNSIMAKRHWPIRAGYQHQMEFSDRTVPNMKGEIAVRRLPMGEVEADPGVYGLIQVWAYDLSGSREH